MKQSIICITLACLALTACNRSEKEAQTRLDAAKEMFEKGEYASVKSEIDSLRILYPKELKVLKEGLTLMRQTELKETERSIAFCDSLLPVRMAEKEQRIKEFVLEKEEEYNEIGTYVWKQQTIERNVQRSYIRCGVDERGEMYLASVYYGTGALKHTGITLSTKEGSFAKTASIAYDGGLNYRFTDLGNTTEVVTYKGANSEDAIKFIYDNAKERIKAEYTGGKAYTLYIAEGDKKALLATYELALILSDIDRIHATKEKAIKRIDYLKEKLTSQSIDSSNE